ncbi:hypothetical protein ILYODFUR_017122 [Ilyodon furcidens]|uniref:Uncharacterized protein n=1 Tax=Ilyodon furcidens TaxID=33524 RepID=A0ABV0UI56_9TELE
MGRNAANVAEDRTHIWDCYVEARGLSTWAVCLNLYTDSIAPFNTLSLKLHLLTFSGSPPSEMCLKNLQQGDAQDKF